MDLGLDKVIKQGNGNTLIYTALLAGAIANCLPTPFDAVYFERVNKLTRDYENGKITARQKEWHIAGEYYFWTTLWYVALFMGVYAFGGKYKNNAKILIALIAGGMVMGAVQKNIQIDEKLKLHGNSRKLQ